MKNKTHLAIIQRKILILSFLRKNILKIVAHKLFLNSFKSFIMNVCSYLIKICKKKKKLSFKLLIIHG